MIADGLIGLGNIKNIPNIFDVAFANPELDSPMFAIELTALESKRPSMLYYNVITEDFPDTVHINCTRTDRWTIPIKVDISGTGTS